MLKDFDSVGRNTTIGTPHAIGAGFSLPGAAGGAQTAEGLFSTSLRAE